MPTSSAAAQIVERQRRAGRDVARECCVRGEIERHGVRGCLVAVERHGLHTAHVVMVSAHAQDGAGGERSIRASCQHDALPRVRGAGWPAVPDGVEQRDRGFDAHEVIRQVQARVTSVAAHHMPLLCKQCPGRRVVRADDDEHAAGEAGFVRTAQHVEHLDHAGARQHAAVLAHRIDVGAFGRARDRIVQQFDIRHEPGVGCDDAHLVVVGGGRGLAPP
nr:hypothetical protein [Trinickia acidisoli]